MLSTHVKPASLSEFSGDCQAFLNSCNLYIGLTLSQFHDDQSKVLWAFSFMKGGQAAHFVDWKMCMYHVIRSLNYLTWNEFEEFCPKNEIQTQTSRLQLTSKGHELLMSMSTVSRRWWTKPITLKDHTSSSSFIRA
jgi:hypothetical protein